MTKDNWIKIHTKMTSHIMPAHPKFTPGDINHSRLWMMDMAMWQGTRTHPPQGNEFFYQHEWAQMQILH